MRTTSTRDSTSPPTHCDCRRGTPMSTPSRVVSAAGSHWRGYSSLSPTCCYSMSPPTTWTPNQWPGLSTFWRISPVPWWPLPTTAIFSTMRRAGFSSWTEAGASRTRATTRPGWKPKKSASSRSSAKRPLIRKPSRPSSSGFAPTRREGKPRTRPGYSDSKSSTRRSSRAVMKPMKSISPRVPDSAIRSSKSAACEKPLAIGCFLTTSALSYPRGASSASSVPTAWANRPCSGF